MTEREQVQAQSLRTWVFAMEEILKTTPDQELSEVQGFMAGAAFVLTVLKNDHRSGRVRAP